MCLSDMKIQATIDIPAESYEEAVLRLGGCIGLIKAEIVDSKQVETGRTIKQNAALHLWFQLLAEALNEAGYDMKEIVRVAIPWSPYSVKESLWRPTQESLLGKKSTTSLSTKDIDKIYDVINRAVGERTNGIHVPFPSVDQVMMQLTEQT